MLTHTISERESDSHVTVKHVVSKRHTLYPPLISNFSRRTISSPSSLINLRGPKTHLSIALHIMTIFFDKVPREIRDQIYELLLVKGDRSHVEWNPPKWNLEKNNLHPAILCTCKQAYTEGLPILYERNRFICDGAAVTRHIGITEDPLTANVNKIKDVRSLGRIRHGSGHKPVI